MVYIPNFSNTVCKCPFLFVLKFRTKGSCTNAALTTQNTKMVISRFTKTNEGPNEIVLIQNLSTIPKHFYLHWLVSPPTPCSKAKRKWQMNQIQFFVTFFRFLLHNLLILFGLTSQKSVTVDDIKIYQLGTRFIL